MTLLAFPLALSSILWIFLSILGLLTLTFVILLPAYTILLAGTTIVRAKLQQSYHVSKRDHGERNDVAPCPWSNTNTSLFQGSVFHIRHQPMVHSFKYPLHFSVVDLDEGSELFGEGNVQPCGGKMQQTNGHRGKLWPLSKLMMLRDEDHLKNGEGLVLNSEVQSTSMQERIINLVHERTEGKLDLRATIDSTENGKQRNGNTHSNTMTPRKIMLVTHLMYYGYCFNPVSLYFILKPKPNNVDDEAEEIEAIVVEVSNTPWNEMSVYVLHPNSVDTVQSFVYPPSDGFKSQSYRYTWRKNFHVSPFMTMDHDYDWKFQISQDRIKVEAKMIRHPQQTDSKDGVLYFTAGFDIHRKVTPSSRYPLQLARIIYRFPIYCFIIQVWIHYEALKLLMKGVQFIPHPEGSETGASKAIAVVMKPVFAAMDIVDTWLSEWRDNGKSKEE